MKRAVIIVAAGTGSRMGSSLPKQYMQLRDKPVIIHTLEKFLSFDPEINSIVVLGQDHQEHWDRLAASFEAARGVVLAPGGRTRYDSVKNGLKHLKKDVVVGIHDAVRPLVSEDTLVRCYDSAEKFGSGIPAVEMIESVRIMEGDGISRHLDRSILRIVQTPQVFRSKQIIEAYQAAYTPAFTDDASVYETTFGAVSLVEGNRENIKITTPQDLELAHLLMASPG
jgi:2-C-methyl-D-erythritol 4-phosphate cytidylyltransferase